MELLAFVSGYNADSKSLICFNWNGKHSSDFEDYNQPFRRTILNYIFEIDQTDIRVELLRDLFLAEAFWAREAWCVYQNFHVIGEKLIRYGGMPYIDDFLEGAFTSFDTYCSSRMMELFDYDFSHLINELKTRKKKAKDSESRQRYKNAIELFKTYMKGNPKEGIISITGSVAVKDVKEMKHNLFSRLLKRFK
jgi:hypothetical protein